MNHSEYKPAVTQYTQLVYLNNDIELIYDKTI